MRERGTNTSFGGGLVSMTAACNTPCPVSRKPKRGPKGKVGLGWVGRVFSPERGIDHSDSSFWGTNLSVLCLSLLLRSSPSEDNYAPWWLRHE